jgi:Mrp family chromosome partitioning ATPase
VRDAADRLRSVGARVLGTILNDVNLSGGDYYYYNRYYYAYYEAENKANRKSAAG